MTDGGGLIFTLSAAGNAAWVLRYRHGTRRPEMTLGPYPAVSLSEARTMALVKRAEIAQGKNPIAERLKAKAALAKDWTVRRLIKDYREKVLVTLAKSTRVCYQRHLKRIENRFGSLGVREVESSDIVALIEDCKLTWGESSLLHTVREAIGYWIAQDQPKVRPFTPHDLRSTTKSHMRALGVPRDISEMCLNHKLTGVEGIYDRHTDYSERREALLTWVQFLMDCEAGDKTVAAKEPVASHRVAG